MRGSFSGCEPWRVGPASREKLLVDAVLFTLALGGIDQLQPDGLVLLLAAELLDGGRLRGIGAAPDHVAVLQVDELAGVALQQAIPLAAVEEALLAGGAA